MAIELEKYKGQSTRFTCPKCGRKRSFTRYIDTDTNIYIDEKVGICNRAVKCGYHLTPKQYFDSIGVHTRRPKVESHEVKLAQISTNSEIRENLCKSVGKKIEIFPINQIDKPFLLKTLSQPSNFLRFLFDNFPSHEVEQVMLDYFVGGAKDNRVVFWQIDNQMRIRTGKIMQYDPQTGKRVKSEELKVNSDNLKIKNYNLKFSAPTWVHSELKKQGILPDDWQLTQCLFGLHLLIKYPNKPIMLVESEKTAIIMALFHPCFNWLATGGLNNLSWEKIYPIRKHKITAFADLKCFEKWSSKTKEINHQIGSKIDISDMLEKIATTEDREKGLDLADYYLRK